MPETTAKPMRTATARTPAKALHWLDKNHRILGVCPGCNLDVTSSVGITKLIYEFVACSCDAETFEHLTEQLWHRECFIEAAEEEPDAGE